MRYLGSHIGLSSPKYFLGSVQEALSYEETAFMFYTGAPQNTRRKPLEELRIEEGKALWLSKSLPLDALVVHAPYIINLGNKENAATYDLGKSFLASELCRAASFGAKTLVLHPGCHVGLGEDHGMESLLLGLEEVVKQDGTNVTLALETMAGKGSELGTNFAFFEEFLTRFPYADRIGICLDTCHLHDAGYDIASPQSILEELRQRNLLQKVKVLHLNDSKNPRGARKDRHENLGYGQIGFDALLHFAALPEFDALPIILETPYVDEKPPYAKEISLLRQGEFEPSWREGL